MNCIGVALLALTACLGNPDPEIRDRTAFERLSAAMRSGDTDRDTLSAIKSRLLELVAEPDPLGFQKPFVILTLAEVARTDRIERWMNDTDREELVSVAAGYLPNITDYRAFNDREGFRHGVAHGADFALQLALNPAITKAQLDRLLSALASQIAPAATAYSAGEPDRLARAVAFIAQRALHTGAEWKDWFAKAVDPRPISGWDVAFRSEIGIRKRHNARAFLLAIFATASSSEDAGIKLLLTPARDSLKLVP